MEFKGSKGKWKVWKDDIIITENNVLDDVICTSPQVRKSQENWRANALLISKAPEMLEMLNEILTSKLLEGSTIQPKIEQLIKEATEL